MIALLKKEMATSSSYTVTIPIYKDGQETSKTRTITVDNDLFSQDLLTEANKILDALGVTKTLSTQTANLKK